MTNNAKNCLWTVFEQEISNQEANLIRMDVEVEAVESDDAEDSDFQTDLNSELEEEESNHLTTSASTNELEKKKKEKNVKLRPIISFYLLQ